jgi:hypothetical protein
LEKGDLFRVVDFEWVHFYVLLELLGFVEPPRFFGDQRGELMLTVSPNTGLDGVKHLPQVG